MNMIQAVCNMKVTATGYVGLKFLREVHDTEYPELYDGRYVGRPISYDLQFPNFHLLALVCNMHFFWSKQMQFQPGVLRRLTLG